MVGQNTKDSSQRIVALRTANNNELLDYYLTLPSKGATILHNYEMLWACMSPCDVPCAPSVLGPKAAFTKLQEIGSGGFSKVYKGKNGKGVNWHSATQDYGRAAGNEGYKKSAERRAERS